MAVPISCYHRPLYKISYRERKVKFLPFFIRDILTFDIVIPIITDI